MAQQRRHNNITTACVIGYGYVGSAIVHYLCKETDIDVTCLTRNKPESTNDVRFVIAEYSQLSASFYSQFDAIILTAGQSSPSSSNNLIQVIYNDILSFAYIIEFLDDTQKLIYMSSAALYGDTCHRIVSEEERVSVHNYYDLGKYVRDSICRLNTSKKQLFGLRIGTLAGIAPITRTDILVNKMVHDAQTSNNVSVGFVNVHRSIVGVNDLCRAVYTIIKSDKPKTSGIYNIGSFNADPIDIANTIKQHFPAVQINCTQLLSPYSFLLNSAKFCDTFGFLFKDSIDQIISDLKNNLKDVKQNTVRSSKNMYKLIKNCRVCGTETTELLDLGHQPLANDYHTYEEIINWYPLCLHYCSNCFHVQLTCTVEPKLLFKNYLYVSGTSITGKQYFYDFAKRSVKRLRSLGRIRPQLRVLDIACNDGSQLDAFKQVCKEECIDVVTVGVDPAKNLYEISSNKGHKIHCNFFDDQLGETLKHIYGEFDIIIAQNVFAHVDSPGKFLDGCIKLINDNSLVYIQTSQAKMIENGEWDTAYHEHLSFFNSNSMNILCKKSGVHLNKIELMPIHGTSYVFEITKTVTSDSNTIDVIYSELEKGLYTEETYNSYNFKCHMYKNEFHNRLLKYKLDGYNIVAFGSTAKFNTILNSIPIDNSMIDFIIDENHLKQGLLTPGSNIPVVPISMLGSIGSKTVIIVSAWNFYKEIRDKLYSMELSQRGESTGEVTRIIKLLNINPLCEEEL